MMVFFISILFLIRYRKKTINLKIISVIYIALFSLLISSIYNSNTTITYIFFYLRYLLIAIIMFNIKLDYKISKLLLVFVIFLNLFILFNSNDSSNFFSNISRNSISIYLILFISFYYISSFQNNKPLNIIFSILIVLISAWSNSRGGFISTLILLLFTLFLYKKSRLSFVFFSFISIIVFFVFKIYESGFFLGLLSRFNQDYSGSITRFDILKQYIFFALKSPLDFLFGVNMLSVPFIIKLEGNPHNSFIHLHALFGFTFTFFILIFIIRFFILYFKNAPLLILVMLVIIVRSATDIPLFGGIYDPIFYFLVFYSLNFDNRKLFNNKGVFLNEKFKHN